MMAVQTDGGSVMMDEGHCVVLEVSGSECSVLTRDGQFLRLHMPNSSVGQELTYRESDIVHTGSLRDIHSKGVRSPMLIVTRILSYAAVVAITLGVALNGPVDVPKQPEATKVHKVVTQAQPLAAVAVEDISPVAYVTVDINPSIELAVDDHNEIIEAAGLNDDGRKVLETADVMGLSLDQAVALISKTAYQLGYLKSQQENEILLTATPVDGSPTSSLDAELETIKTAALREVGKNDPKMKVKVAAVAVAEEVRQKASQAQLSVGKYIVLDAVRTNGVRMTPDQMRKASLRKVLIESGLDINQVVREYGISHPVKIGSDSQFVVDQPKYAKTNSRSTKASQGQASSKVNIKHSKPEHVVTTLPTLRYEAPTDGIEIPAQVTEPLGTETVKRDLVKKVIVQFDLLPPAVTQDVKQEQAVPADTPPTVETLAEPPTTGSDVGQPVSKGLGALAIPESQPQHEKKTKK